MGHCEDRFLSDQSKWSDEKKKELARRRGAVNPTFFFTLHDPLNRLARELSISDATFLFALSSHESGWLDEENTWLKNPFGMTMAGAGNLGFDSFEQAFAYWKCRYAHHVTGATSMDAFMAGLKAAKHNPNDAYYDHERWQAQWYSVRRWAAKYGYAARPDRGTIVLVPGQG